MRPLPTAILTAFIALGAAACASDTPKKATSTSSETGSPTPITSTVDLPAEPNASASSAFWDYWGDGKAELSAYRGETSRYGELREAEVVLIYVTEPLSRKTWVKDDDAPDDEKLQVMKLNHVAKFRTGIYPYSVMTSTFSPVDDYDPHRFQPVKSTLTAQEWCGHVFHGIWIGSDSYASGMHSYFAGEEDARDVVETPAGTLYEDALFIQLRELDGEFNDGEDWSGTLVPRLWERRKEHKSLRPVDATITRSDAEFDGRPVTRFELQYEGKTATFDVAKEPPHRLIHWSRSDGTDMKLVGTDRLPYWKLNNPGDQSHLESLNIAPPQGPNEPGKADEGADEQPPRNPDAETPTE
ncbi:MAG: hypothetical protein ACQEVA_13875 [Myxococcota bacterium]